MYVDLYHLSLADIIAEVCSKTYLQLCSVLAHTGLVYWAMSGGSGGAWSRVYADINSHKPREYWDYESHPIEWG